MVYIEGQDDWLDVSLCRCSVGREPSERVEDGRCRITDLCATSCGECGSTEALLVVSYKCRYSSNVFVAWFVLHVVRSDEEGVGG